MGKERHTKSESFSVIFLCSSKLGLISFFTCLPLALLYKWKAKLTEEPILNHDEKAELLRLRKEIKQLRMEQEILKKASAYFAKHVK